MHVYHCFAYDFFTRTRGRFGLGTFWPGDVLTWDVFVLGRFGLGTFWFGDVLTGKLLSSIPNRVLE